MSGHPFDSGQNSLHDVIHLVNARGVDVFLTCDRRLIAANEKLRAEVDLYPRIECPTELRLRFATDQEDHPSNPCPRPKTSSISSNLCHVLRDDGITYHEYVTELTDLLFLKMAKDTRTENQRLKGYRWDDVTKNDGVELPAFYEKLLIDSGGKGPGRAQAIFANASTSFRELRHPKQVVTDNASLDWHSARHVGLGELYDGFLEKSAEKTKAKRGMRPKTRTEEVT